MEELPKDPYLEFRPDVLQIVRKEFNLHQPAAMEEVIKNFEEWIEKQNHFTKKKFTKHFLEDSMILGKGSLERAKKTLDKLATLKTLIPRYFIKHDMKNEMLDLSKFMTPAILPKTTPDNYRVFMQKYTSADISTEMFNEYYRFCVLMCVYMKNHDYAYGFVTVIDTRDINVVNFALRLNAVEFRHIMTGYDYNGFAEEMVDLFSTKENIEYFKDIC